MKVCSLSGASGTGKSTSALVFAHKVGLEAIIDDGLLIINGVKVAGISAKFEKNTITAVRRAIFSDAKHCEDTKKALDTYKVQSILLIGTSDKMTKNIAQRLELGPIDTFYYVEDIRSRKEIQKARFVRTTQGKHVMPIPYRQVEQNFFKRLIQRGKRFSHRNVKKLGKQQLYVLIFSKNILILKNRCMYSLLHIVVRKKPL